MNSNILTIMKKELSRFLGDRRIVFSSILLPGIMIYLLYTFMGSAMGSLIGNKDTAPKIAAVQMPASVAAIFKEQKIETKTIDPSDQQALDSIKQQIKDKDFDLLMIFPEEFDALVEKYSVDSGTAAPNIEMFYNSTNTSSSGIYSSVVKMLNEYEASLSNKFDINSGDAVFDLASDRDLSAMMFSSLMPLLLTIFLFSGCMAIAPEAIAGEKERGTLSTLLVTPLKRSELALGKIFSVTVIAVLSAASSTLGTLLSLPKLMGGVSDGMEIYYTTSDYIVLALIILCTVLLFVSIISIISAFAKSIKEAQTYVAPLMIIVMLTAVSGMFGGTVENPLFYLIPVFNSVQCMSSIFSFEIIPLNVAITVASNFIYCGILAFSLTKMFNSEKIMFSR